MGNANRVNCPDFGDVIIQNMGCSMSEAICSFLTSPGVPRHPLLKSGEGQDSLCSSRAGTGTLSFRT